MSRPLLRLLGLALALALLACAPPRARHERIAFAPCQLGSASTPARVEARCATVEVPEDWSRPAGRTIALRVAVVRAEAPKPEPDPVFMLAGGPGQAATDQFPAVAPAFERLRRDRDLVLVDQRGTGGSSRLACPPSGSAPLAPSRSLSILLSSSEGDDLALVTACARAQPGDPAQYTTPAFARDLDRVRDLLGRERVNLVAFSYGTRAALAYLRLFPGRVRTLVLDGVAPPEMAIGAHFGRDGQRALGLLFQRCAADAACRERFPDPGARLAALSSRLRATSPRVEVADPVTGALRVVAFGLPQLRRVVSLFTYAPETAALLPVLLERASSKGQLAPLAAQGLLLADDFEAALSRPLQWSVLCAEDVPFYGPAGPEDAASFLGDEVRRTLPLLCRVWPHAPPDPALRRPVHSDVPALLLSGEGDPVTPPSWAEVAARSLPRSRHLVLPGGGHGTLYRGCLPMLAARFVEAGSAEGLDAACLERSRPAPFFLDLLGPAP